MKKLLTLLLALTMTLSLALPAAAYDPTQDTAPPLWEEFGYNSYEELMSSGWLTAEEYTERVASAKRYQAWLDAYKMVNAETLAAFDADAYFAQTYSDWVGGKAGYMEMYELADQSAFYEAMQSDYIDHLWVLQENAQTRDRFLAEHGGVVGGLNVMRNGTYLTFPAGRAPYAKDGVVYADANTLATALAVKLTGAVDGYVAVRAAAEAANVSIYWDSEYQSVVLLDEKALVAELDKRFTVLNGLLAKWKPDLSRTTQSTVNSKASITMYDTLDGDKLGSLSFNLTGLSSAKGLEMTGKYDASRLLELITTLFGGNMAAENPIAFAQIKELIKADFSMRMDYTTAKVYLKSSALAPVLGPLTGETIPDNAWYAANLGSVDMPALLEMSNTTLGQQFLPGAALAGSESDERSTAYLYQSTLEQAARYASLFGDERFVKDGSNRTLTLTADDAAALFGAMGGGYGYPDQLAVTLTVRPDGGVAGKMTYQGRQYGENVARVTADFDLSPTSQRATVEVHVKNTVKVTVTVNGTTTTSTKAPSTTPPEGATIVEF